jgi:guanosine-3',5'-bis(diphosphate) 3'-pyrophosphohydrolase
VGDFATRAHGAQKRKYSDDPYIVHPVRVMKLCGEYTSDVTILSAALLHDVLEDTPVSASEIMAFLTDLMPREDAIRTYLMVVDLTDVYTKEKFPALNRKKRKEMEHERMSRIHPASQTVKYADIIDNCIDICHNDPGFAPKYIEECRKTLEKINKGDARLYARALQSLREGAAILDRRRKKGNFN